ncbi:MAG: GNVR domain-containing protein [Pseudomonadota bacterium]
MTFVPRLPIDLIIGILTAAWRRRYLIALPILIVPFLAVGAGFMAPKSYKASMTILVQEAAVLNPFLKDLVVATSLKERMAALSQLLKGRQLMGEVATDLEWIDAETAEDRRDETISYLGSVIDVKLVGKELLEISYKSDAPQGMDDVLIAVSRRFMDRVLAPERSSLRGSETFLDGQMETISDELAQAEADLSEFKTKNAGQLPELHAANVARLASMKQSLAERRTELVGARASFETMKATLVRNNPLVAQMEQRLVELDVRLVQLRSRYTDRHSEVQSILRQQEQIRAEREEAIVTAGGLSDIDLERLWSATQATEDENGQVYLPVVAAQIEALQAARARIDGLVEEIRALESGTVQLETAVASFGEVERRLGELTRSVTLKRELFVSLKQRFQMARVTAELGSFEAPERVRVIDYPKEPTAPVSPGPILFAIAGVVGGVALGFGLALLAELLDTSIRSRRDLERLIGVKVITRLPAHTAASTFIASANREGSAEKTTAKARGHSTAKFITKRFQQFRHGAGLAVTHAIGALKSAVASRAKSTGDATS